MYMLMLNCRGQWEETRPIIFERIRHVEFHMLIFVYMYAVRIVRDLSRYMNHHGHEPVPDVESLFAKELAKRGISGSSIDDSGSSPEAPARSSPPPQLAQKEATPSETPQLDRSRALNSEGLEGLIPRASILLRLGGSFFLGFVPFILLVSALFVGLYVVCPCAPLFTALHRPNK